MREQRLNTEKAAKADRTILGCWSAILLTAALLVPQSAAKAQKPATLPAPALLAAAEDGLAVLPSGTSAATAAAHARPASSPSGPAATTGEDAIAACLGDNPQAVAVTYQPAEGTFVSVSGEAFFAGDLHVLQGGGVISVGTAAGGMRSETAYEAVPLGQENRWGQVPAWILAGTGAARKLLQEQQLEEGLALFAPVHAAGACANVLRQAEALARQARSGSWSKAEPRLILPANMPERFAGMDGQYVIARGRVVSLGKTRSTRYLNFGNYWKTDFTVTLNSADEEAFNLALGRSGRTLDTLAGELVELRGFVQDRDGPLMALRHPEQLVVLDE